MPISSCRTRVEVGEQRSMTHYPWSTSEATFEVSAALVHTPLHTCDQSMTSLPVRARC